MSEQAGPERIEGRIAFADAALKVAQSAKRELLLMTFDFDRSHYGSEAFVDTVKTFALASEHARVCVLINQPKIAMRSAHRLVELGRLIPSRIGFRELLEERMSTHRADWLIADGVAFLERREPDALYARSTLAATPEAREHANDFRTLWEESPGAQELRVLGI